MGLLQYTSSEMFSSTELVRKSKNIFDKLNKNEIEKAIILRDGKPNIILLDFNEYERIISEYLQLKKDGSLATPKPTYKKESIEFQEEKPNEIKNLNEIDEIQLQNALDEIDKLEFSFDSKKAKEEKSEQLKEFWD
ncbi:MAG: hypothetical protein KA073_02755 [Aliarcobacter sp.]|nr:hypothetical protein [Aliarcobacter sp.]